MKLKTMLGGALFGLVMACGVTSLPAANGLSAAALQQGITSLAPMLKEVTPAVVSVRVDRRYDISRSSARADRDLPEGLRRFFRYDGEDPAQGFLPGPPQARAGAGSGVIIDAGQGLIVTNSHVVSQASSITVTLSDNREFEADLVGTDPDTDVALLRIDADGLLALDFADSDSAEVGDFVLAIGNPFGIGQTVTSGIVSALGRSGLNRENYEDFIQTDAAINRGNSGGALVDMDGRLLGINTAIISGTGGGSDGIGFAVPSNMVAAIAEHLKRDGEVRRGMLGVQIDNLTGEMARSLNLDVNAGALVTGVVAGGAAEEAGLRIYDVIVSIDDQPVESSRELRNYVGLMRQGEAIELGLYRDKERLSVTATIGERVGLAGINRRPSLQPSIFQGTPLTSAVAELDGDTVPGVLVGAVAPESLLRRAGLREGDIIIQVNRRPVESVDGLTRLLRSSRGIMALTVVSENSELLLILR